MLSNSCIETQIYVVSFLLFLDISQEEDYSLPPVYNYHQITMDCFKIMLQEPWEGHCHKHQGWNPAGSFHGSHRHLSLQTTPLYN